ncbi:MAG: hypothetical protein V7765_07795 [Oleispira sp.]
MYFKSFTFITIPLFLTCSLQVNALVEFQTGDVATAKNFNDNFQELKQEIKDANDDLNSLNESTTAHLITATVNGVTKKIVANGTFYSIPSNSGYIYVGVDGYPSGSLYPYYASNDCTGQKYVNDPYLKKEDSWINPLINGAQQFDVENTSDGKLVYRKGDSVIDLYYQSREINGKCYPQAGNSIVRKAIINDPEVTGVTFPIQITGVGEQVTIDEVIGEVPVVPTVEYPEVYANGVNIGYLKSIPSSKESYIHVQLYDYNDDIYLYKNGTYSGFGIGVYSKRLYYITPDCSGNKYVEMISNHELYWWDASKHVGTRIKNNDTHYSLSDDVYKFDDTAVSYQDYHSETCRTTTVTNSFGYKKATPTSTPDVLIIEPPIVIEGWDEPTPYNQLPIAD